MNILPCEEGKKKKKNIFSFFLCGGVQNGCSNIGMRTCGKNTHRYAHPALIATRKKTEVMIPKSFFSLAASHSNSSFRPVPLRVAIWSLSGNDLFS